eukprot:7380900-Prymnesium_polylepis.2
MHLTTHSWAVTHANANVNKEDSHTSSSSSVSYTSFSARMWESWAMLPFKFAYPISRRLLLTVSRVNFLMILFSTLSDISSSSDSGDISSRGHFIRSRAFLPGLGHISHTSRRNRCQALDPNACLPISIHSCASSEGFVWQQEGRVRQEEGRARQEEGSARQEEGSARQEEGAKTNHQEAPDQEVPAMLPRTDDRADRWRSPTNHARTSSTLMTHTPQILGWCADVAWNTHRRSRAWVLVCLFFVVCNR